MLGPWDTIALVLNAASFVAVFQASGVAFFIAAFFGAVPESGWRIRRLGARAAALGIGLVVLRVLLEPAHLAGAAAGLSDAALHRLVMASDLGTATMLRLAGLVTIVLALGRSTHASATIAVVGAVLACLSFGLTGHTATSPLRPVLLPLLGLHLMLAAFWFGSLWPLGTILRHETAATAARILDDYSRKATFLVPLIAVAGIAMALALADPPSALPGSGWGRILLVKLALFGALMLLAAANKLRLVPRLRSGDAGAASALRASIAAEMALIVLVFMATAILTGLFSPPGEDAIAGWAAGCLTADDQLARAAFTISRIVVRSTAPGTSLPPMMNAGVPPICSVCANAALRSICALI